ncbi:hypothetical protein AWH69_02125 [Janibacter melonis]|uniref:PQQ-binding-like beta-propeller repeat protein n=1 Tax=Janibacter melonis TaxID=262209 RepID=A0A176QG28_9MICO|nr:hypothetical protein [Janibacter melonis]OAB88621.1 hypothetical protein AWH69_02125 [Janibacter melonis]
MPRTRRRGLAVVSGTLFTLAVGVSAVLAARSTGEPVHEIALGDGGVWVTSGASGMWGRVDRGANQLGTVVPGGGPQAATDGVPDVIPRTDVLQDGRLVVGVTTTGALVPVDPTTGVAGSGRGQIPKATTTSGERLYRGSVVDMRGGTIAMIEPQTGRIWAQRLDPDGAGDLTSMTPSSPSLATVDQGPAAIAVDVDGNIKAVSATTGTVVDIPAEGDGFGDPETTTLELGGRGVDITAVGDRWVVLDASNGQVWVEGEDDPQNVDGAAAEGGVLYAALQVPGVEADTVAVATDLAVSSVSTRGSGSSRRGIDFGSPSKDLSIKTLHVARPVVNGACLVGTRSSSSTIAYQVVCRDETLPATQIGLQGNPNRRNPAVVRLNRGQVVLNDLDTGRVFDLSLDGRDLRIDTWPTADQLTTLKSRSS